MLEIRLFGQTTVTRDGETLPASALGGVKPRQILEILAISGGHPVRKEHLAELLWEGDPPRSYLGTLESYVCGLRKAIGARRGRDSALRTVAHGYLLDQEAVSVDVTDFRRRVRAGTAVGVAESPLALETLESALALVGGDLLADEPYAAWAMREREVFQRELVQAASLGARRAMALDAPGRAVELARCAVAADPLAEDAWRLMMRALHATGRRGEALRAYSDLRAHLREALGAEPCEPTRNLYLDLLRSESAASGARPPLADDEEVRMLVRLLRQALESVGVPAGGPDHDLARAVADLATAS